MTRRDATLVTVIVPILLEYEVDPLPLPQIPLKTQPKPSTNIPRLTACKGGDVVSAIQIDMIYARKSHKCTIMKQTNLQLTRMHNNLQLIQ